MVPLSVSTMQWGPVLRYGVPGVLAGCLLSLVLGSSGTRPLRAEPGSSGSDAGLVAFTTTAPGNPNASLLYLVDSRTQSFAIYRFDAMKGSVKLEAARQFRSDLRLAEFNNLPPEVAAVEAMVSTAVPRGLPSQRQ